MTKPFPCCNCDEPCCGFSGSFTYNTMSCNLVFSATLCREFDISDLVLVITGPSGTSAIPFVLTGTNVSWVLFRPELGVWNATLTLTCLDTGGTYAQAYSDTVIACPITCCELKVPNTLALNNSATCCTFGNGTHVLTRIDLTCGWSKQTFFPAPDTPCVGACFTLTKDDYVFYFHPRYILVQIYLDPSLYTYPVGFVIYFWYVYSRFSGGRCGTPFGGATGSNITWQYRFNCEDGEGIPEDPDGFNHGELTLIFGSPTDTVSGFPCGTTAPSLIVDYL